jgi:hypothetical protein
MPIPVRAHPPFFHEIFTLTSSFRVDHDHRDPYEEAYDPEPYAAAPATHLDPHFYQNANQFPPPPGESTQNLNMPMPQPYPPPPGAGPTTAQNYPAYGVPGPEQYARRADDNVRNPFRGGFGFFEPG